MSDAIKIIKCYVHPDRDAGHVLRIPCAPGGVIYVCDECNNNRQLPFDAYFNNYKKRIEKFKNEHKPTA